MTEIRRAALFGKLNPVAYRAIEAATVFCKMRGNSYVELVHWLHQLLQLNDTDLHRIVRNANIDPGRLAKDVVEALDGEASGAMAPAADGQAGGAEEASPSTSPRRPARARWTRSPAATTKSARSSTS
jgi:ATP-dependent Clp protease ATP-binding subunit ClpA